MKTCKLKPSVSYCRNCIEMQMQHGVNRSCDECETNKRYELLDIGTKFWSGDYAMILKDGNIVRVSLNQIYDVRDGWCENG